MLKMSQVWKIKASYTKSETSLNFVAGIWEPGRQMAFKLKFDIKLFGSSWKFLIFAYCYFKEESLE